MSHSFTTHFSLGNFNAAAVADNALITDFFILSAMALPVLGRSENTLAEKTVPFRLEGSVIYCFGLLDLTVRPFTDFFGRCKSDLYCFEVIKFQQIIQLLICAWILSYKHYSSSDTSSSTSSRSSAFTSKTGSSSSSSSSTTSVSENIWSTMSSSIVYEPAVTNLSPSS